MTHHTHMMRFLFESGYKYGYALLFAVFSKTKHGKIRLKIRLYLIICRIFEDKTRKNKDKNTAMPYSLPYLCPTSNTKTGMPKHPCLKISFITTLRSYDLIRILEIMSLNCFLSHLVLEDLTCCVHRESVNEVDISRNLVLSHVIHDKLLNLFF